MTDEKKPNNVEITDEQANDAAGGRSFNSYTCDGCGRRFFGEVPYYVNYKAYCVNCFGKYQNKPKEARSKSVDKK